MNNLFFERSPCPDYLTNFDHILPDLLRDEHVGRVVLANQVFVAAHLGEIMELLEPIKGFTYTEEMLLGQHRGVGASLENSERYSRAILGKDGRILNMLFGATFPMDSRVIEQAAHDTGRIYDINQKRMHLCDLATRRDVENQGYATANVNLLLGAAARDDIALCTVRMDNTPDNMSVIKYYDGRGFRVFAREQNDGQHILRAYHPTDHPLQSVRG